MEFYAVTLQFCLLPVCLRVLAVLGGQVVALRQLPDFVLRVTPKGEQRLPQLVLGQRAEEVRLILDGVGAEKQPDRPLPTAAAAGAVDAAAGGVRHRPNPCDTIIAVAAVAGALEPGVVPRCHVPEVLPDVVVEHPELDPAVAHHVRVGRAALAGLPHRVRDHLIPVLLLQGDHLEGDARLLAHRRGVRQVFLLSTGRYWWRCQFGRGLVQQRPCRGQGCSTMRDAPDSGVGMVGLFD